MVTSGGNDRRENGRREAGGKQAGTVAELARACNAVLILVVNAEQTEDVLFRPDGLAAHLRPGSVVIASATVDPAYPPAWAARLEAAGLWLIDAPVSGGAVKAAAGEMTVMASGRPEAFAAAGGLLDAIAGKVYRLGDRAGIGSTMDTSIGFCDVPSGRSTASET